MPQEIPTPPIPPTPQIPGGSPAPTTFYIPQDLRPPTTRAEVEGLRIRRGELSDQIQSATSRREAIADEIMQADPAARPGLQARLDVLDARIVQLEQDLALTGRLLTSPEAGIAQASDPGAGMFGSLDSDQITGITIVFTIFVLFPIAIALARLLWKKATSAPVVRNTDDSERLERVEQAVETIAIEVERISEGQRFVTKLLAQPNGVPLAATQRPGEPAVASRSSSSDPGERR